MKPKLIRKIWMLMMAVLLPLWPAAAADMDSDQLIYSNFNIGAVQNNPKYYPAYDAGGENVFLHSITTYHWNGGMGSEPGTISIYDWNADLIGVWPAQGQNNNTYWTIFPDIVLKKGTRCYFADSDPETWSHNTESADVGFIELRGIPSDNQDMSTMPPSSTDPDISTTPDPVLVKTGISVGKDNPDALVPVERTGRGELPVSSVTNGNDVKLSVDKTLFAPEEEITVSYTGITQAMVDNYSWICISDSGSPSTGYKGGWQSVNTGGSGYVKLKAPFEEGTYELRFYRGSSANDENLDRSTIIPFTVEHPELTKNMTVSIQKTVFAPEEEIIVSYSGVTDWLVDHNAWFCISDAGSMATSYKSGWMEPAVGSGYVKLKAPFDEGDYEIRFYDGSSANDLNLVTALTIPFTVVHAELTKDITVSIPKAVFAPEEEIIVSYSGITQWLVDHNAWFCISDAGSTAASYKSGWMAPTVGSGYVKLQAPFDEGNYEIRFYDGSSANDLNLVTALTIPFTVVHAELTKDVTASIPKAVFAPEEDIIVSYSGMTQWLVDHNAWFCISDAGSMATSYKSGWQAVTQGSGNVVLKAPSEEGNYEVRFYDGSSANDLNLAQRLTIPFTVSVIQSTTIPITDGKNNLESPPDQTVAFSPTAVPVPPIEPVPTSVPEPPIASVPTIVPGPPIASLPTIVPGPPIASVPTTAPEPPIAAVPTIVPGPPIASLPTTAPEPPIAAVPTSVPGPTIAAVPTSVPEPIIEPNPTMAPELTSAPKPTVGQSVYYMVTETDRLFYLYKVEEGSSIYIKKIPVDTWRIADKNEVEQASLSLTGDGGCRLDVSYASGEKPSSDNPCVIISCIYDGMKYFGMWSEEDQERTSFHEKTDIRGVSGDMPSGTLTHEGASVSFSDGETGQAVLVSDPFGISGPNGDGQVYDLGFTAWPTGPIQVEFDTPEPADDEEYIIWVGIPVKSRKGEVGFEWIPLPTEMDGGRIRATLQLGGIDEYLADISFEEYGEMAAEVINNTAEWGKTLSGANLASSSISAVGDLIGSVSLIWTKEIVVKNTLFRLHIPAEKYDKYGKNNLLIWPGEMERYAADMKKAYDYYAANYDVSKRTVWPMDVYFVSPWSDYVACFCPPYASLGGRLGVYPIDGAYMKIDVGYASFGYGRPKSPYTTKLYGAIAHELFHFVQRCYVSKGNTQLWFDESSAAYYDSLFTDTFGDLQMEENYRKEWIVQFSMLTENPLAKNEYGRMPVFCYLQQRDDEFLKKAYEYLKKTGGLSNWPTVFEFAAGTTMAPLVRGYYQALVTKGSVYAINNEPWTIYDAVSGSNKSLDAKDKASWATVGYKEILNGSEQSGRYIMGPYSARFVALDTTNLPPGGISMTVRLTTPGVDGTLFKIDGTSYADVTYEEIASKSEKAMVVRKGDKLLLMLVNERNSDCYGAVSYSYGDDGGMYIADEDLIGVDWAYISTKKRPKASVAFNGETLSVSIPEYTVKDSDGNTYTHGAVTLKGNVTKTANRGSMLQYGGTIANDFSYTFTDLTFDKDHPRTFCSLSNPGADQTSAFTYSIKDNGRVQLVIKLYGTEKYVDYKGKDVSQTECVTIILSSDGKNIIDVFL